MTAKTFTPRRAALDCARRIRAEYPGADPAVWTKVQCSERGLGSATAAVVWETDALEAWAVSSPRIIRDGQPWSGVFAEPHTGSVLCFYADPDHVVEEAEAAAELPEPGESYEDDNLPAVGATVNHYVDGDTGTVTEVFPTGGRSQRPTVTVIWENERGPHAHFADELLAAEPNPALTEGTASATHPYRGTTYGVEIRWTGGRTADVFIDGAWCQDALEVGDWDWKSGTHARPVTQTVLDADLAEWLTGADEYLRELESGTTAEQRDTVREIASKLPAGSVRAEHHGPQGLIVTVSYDDGREPEYAIDHHGAARRVQA